jgi:hypothetical protein
MIPYYTIFLIPVLFAIFYVNKKNNINIFFWIINSLLLFVFIGFRYGINDWFLYESMFENIHRTNNINEAIKKIGQGDIGFILLNYFVKSLGFEFQFLNIIIATFCIFCLTKFAYREENPWLVIVISIPIVIIIIFMGFVRQGIAFSFLLLGFLYLIEKKIIKFAITVFLATLFHKSALFFIIFLISKYEFKNIWKIIIIIFFILIFVLLYIFLKRDVFHIYFYYYLGFGKEEFGYFGAYSRIFLNLLPSIIFLIKPKFFSSNSIELRLLFFLSISVILLCFLVTVQTLFIDRINYYFVILQLVIYSRIYTKINSQKLKKIYALMLSLYSILITLIWFSFGKTSHAWLPYKFNIDISRISLFRELSEEQLQQCILFSCPITY